MSAPALKRFRVVVIEWPRLRRKDRKLTRKS